MFEFQNETLVEYSLAEHVLVKLICFKVRHFDTTVNLYISQFKAWVTPKSADTFELSNLNREAVRKSKQESTVTCKLNCSLYDEYEQKKGNYFHI